MHDIRVGNGTLHLKSLMSMAGNKRLVFGESDNARECQRLVQEVCTVDYDVMTVPDDAAANCVLLNGTLLHRHSSEYPESATIFSKLEDVTLFGLVANELAKVDGALTCCSLLY